jgi:hypothetical protein
MMQVEDHGIDAEVCAGPLEVQADDGDIVSYSKSD